MVRKLMEGLEGFLDAKVPKIPTVSDDCYAGASRATVECLSLSGSIGLWTLVPCWYAAIAFLIGVCMSPLIGWVFLLRHGSCEKVRRALKTGAERLLERETTGGAATGGEENVERPPPANCEGQAPLPKRARKRTAPSNRVDGRARGSCE